MLQNAMSANSSFTFFTVTMAYKSYRWSQCHILHDSCISVSFFGILETVTECPGYGVRQAHRVAVRTAFRDYQYLTNRHDTGRGF